MVEKNTKVILNDNDVDKIEYHISTTEKQLRELRDDILLMKRRSRNNKVFRKIFRLIRRIDVKSGINLLKVLIWIAIAWTIISFSADINAKIIGAFTYFGGLAIDMLLLRKQLPWVGHTVFRLVVGAFFLWLMGIILVLIVNLMSSSQGVEIALELSRRIDICLYFCGFVSTCLEFINSIASDD